MKLFSVELLSSLMDTVRINMDALFALTDSVVKESQIYKLTIQDVYVKVI